MEIYLVYSSYMDLTTIEYVGTDINKARLEAEDAKKSSSDVYFDVWVNGEFKRRLIAHCTNNE